MKGAIGAPETSAEEAQKLRELLEETEATGHVSGSELGEGFKASSPGGSVG